MAQGCRYGVAPRARRPRARSEPEPLGARQLRVHPRSERVRLRGRSIQPLDDGIEVRRLPSPADAAARLPALGPSGVLRFAGSARLPRRARARAARLRHGARGRAGQPLLAAGAARAAAPARCRRVVATVWENIPLPPAANPLVARRARAVAAGLDYCIAITCGRPAAPRARGRAPMTASRCCRWGSTSSASRPRRAARTPDRCAS